MAAATQITDEAPEAAPAAAPKKSGGKLLLIIGLIVVLAGAGAGYFLFMKPKASESAHGEEAAASEGEHGGAHGESAEKGSGSGASYLALSPAFTVNLNDEEASRYLQVEMEVMSRSAAGLDSVKQHMPRIRNNLLLLLGQQKYYDLNTRAGKEKLQAEVLAEVQKILKAETGKPGVEAVYFTSFVMQ